MTTTQTTDIRQERGKMLSHDNRIKCVAGVTWLVPSQTQPSGGYLVNLADGTCSCPDCHNLSCLVMAMHRLGIEPSFLAKAVTC